MVKMTGPFSHLGPKKALVLGDLNMDTYTLGKVSRISPEAPVPVVHVQQEQARPGCAGNVALSLVALGMNVTVLGRIGPDFAGEQMKEYLQEKGVDVSALVVEEGYQTPIKNRVIAGTQQVVRVDYENNAPLSKSDEHSLIERLPFFLEGVEVLAISDYGKGFLTQNILLAVIELANLKNIPVIVDPKGKCFAKYCGATVIKPNYSEALAASHLPVTASLSEIAQKLFRDSEAKVLLITRSEEGISVFIRENFLRFDFPVKVKEVNDVTGAGDTVLAMIAASLANGLSIGEAAQLSNFAAGIAIEHMGCAHVSLKELAERLLEYDVVNKVFEEEHLFALLQVLKGARYHLLVLQEEDRFTKDLFEGIQKIATDEEIKLVLHIKNFSKEEEGMVELFASLHEVDFIVLSQDSLRHLCERMSPERVFSVEDGQVVAQELLEV